MNKWTIKTTELKTSTPWLAAMKEREARKTPTYEMQQREATAKSHGKSEQIFQSIDHALAEKIKEIRAERALAI